MPTRRKVLAATAAALASTAALSWRGAPAMAQTAAPAAETFALDPRFEPQLVRIKKQFAAAKKNHNRSYNKVTNSLMEGKYDWMMTGYHDVLPPSYRDAPAGSAAEEEHAPAK